MELHRCMLDLYLYSLKRKTKRDGGHRQTRLEGCLLLWIRDVFRTREAGSAATYLKS